MKRMYLPGMTDEMFGKLLTGIQKSASNLLDNIGITVAYSKLPSWPEYDEWSRRRFGDNWFTRVWCRHFRPWLLPKKHAEIDANFRDAQDKIRADLINAVIEEGGKT